MNIAKQMETMRDALADWARGNGGTIAIAGDPLHLVHLLSAAPGGIRGILLFDSEEVRGDFDELGRTDRKFRLVISRGSGFNFERGDSLTKGSAGGRAMFELVEEAREILRGMQVESPEDIDETSIVYLRTSHFDYGDTTVDAYQIEFQIASQLPEHRD